jgi:hypothetical protein
VNLNFYEIFFYKYLLVLLIQNTNRHWPKYHPRKKLNPGGDTGSLAFFTSYHKVAQNGISSPLFGSAIF